MSPISRCGARWYNLTATQMGVAGALLLAACASSPPAAKVAMSAARQAIALADQAHITDPASPELAEARIRLAAADAALRSGHMLAAERLAQESRVDAELAVAQANASHDHTVNAEMLPGTDAVAQQVQPLAGAKP